MSELLSGARRVFDRSIARRFVLLTFASIVITGLDILGIALLVPLVDDLSGSSGAGGFELPVLSDLSTEALLGLVVGFFVLKSVAMAGLRWWSAGVVARSAALSSIRLFAAYLVAPISFHDARNSAETVRTMNHTMLVLHQRGLAGGATAIADGATLIVLAVFVLAVSPVPAVIGSVYLALAAVVFLRLVRARTTRHADAMELLSGEVVLSLNEALGGLREHRVRGSEPGLLAAFNVTRNALARAERFTIFVGELPRYFLETLVLGGFGVVAAVVLATQDGPEALATLAVLLAVVLRIVPSLSRLLGSVSNIRIGRSALATLIGDLDLMGVTRLGAVSTSLPARAESPSEASPQSIELREVTFSYVGGSGVALEGVDLIVEPGRSVGVVGPSGSGKSTLIDILCGIRPPDSGSVLVGGHEVGGGDDLLVGTVGLVPQDVFVVDGSIRRNVAFGLEEDDERVWNALRKAHLAEHVSTLPGGLDAVVGERGTRLSGGQRQRLGIARALYREPSILVLDEATAALDVETEEAVVAAISDLAGQVSLVVVAHRLSTVRRCDSVAYLDQGRIRAFGTFGQIANEVPEFARALRLAGLTEGQP